MKSRIVRIFPFYYGWIILIAGSLGVLFSIPGQTMGVSVFTDHLISNLNLSRANISLAYMIGTLSSALLMTHVGKIYDRFGVRIVAMSASLLLGLTLMFLSKSVVISGYLGELFNLPGNRIAFVVMVLGFFGIRFCGQGVLTLVSRGMVMKWFELHRGLVAALMGIVTSFGFSYSPVVFQFLIDHSEWNGAWFQLGSILILGVIPFIFLVFRDTPESCGLQMEEGVKSNPKRKKSNSNNEQSYTLQEAKKDSKLWCYLAVLFFWAMYNTAFTFHITDIFKSFGRSTQDAVAIFPPITVISIIARFGGSWLSDFLKLKYIFYTIILTMLMAAIGISLPYSSLSQLLIIIGMGLSSGFFGTLTAVTWPKLYGRKHLGAISGLAMSFIVAGSAIGPYIFGLMKTFWGHYRYTGTIGIVWVTLIALISLPIILRSES